VIIIINPQHHTPRHGCQSERPLFKVWSDKQKVVLYSKHFTQEVIIRFNYYVKLYFIQNEIFQFLNFKEFFLNETESMTRQGDQDREISIEGIAVKELHVQSSTNCGLDCYSKPQLFFVEPAANSTASWQLHLWYHLFPHV
jgi:hypothetical protein